MTYVDTSGEEWEQPADLVLLCAFQLFNVQLLLLSGIGMPYDPNTGQGQIGRNFTHQVTSSAIGFFDKAKYNFNPFIASGRDRHVHRRIQWRQFRSRAARVSSAAAISGKCRRTAGRSKQRRCRPARPRGDRNGNKRLRDNYLSTVYSGAGVHASCYSYRTNHLDLDPTYKDRFGRPLLRMTMDFHDNEIKMSAYLTDKYAEIIETHGREAGRQAAAQGPLRHHQVPDLAFVRRRDHGG